MNTLRSNNEQSRLLVIPGVLLALGLTACGGSEQTDALRAEPGAPAQPAPSQPGEITVEAPESYAPNGPVEPTTSAFMLTQTEFMNDGTAQITVANGEGIQHNWTLECIDAATVNITTDTQESWPAYGTELCTDNMLGDPDEIILNQIIPMGD